MTSTQQLLAKNLKAIRKEKGLQQSTIAEKSGVIASTYSRIESCIVSPNLSTLEKLAEAMEVSLEDFFREEKVVEQTLLDKLEMINGLSEYNKNVINIMLDSMIEKDRVEKTQEIKMKKRLKELDFIKKEK